MTPDAYRKLCKDNGVKVARNEPEHRLQVECAGWLSRFLHDGVKWIGGAAGLRLTPRTRDKAASAGCLRAGWPDLSFIDAKGPAFVELKVGASLTKDQREFRDLCQRAGHRWALCRSLVELKAAVIGWGMCIPEAC